MIPSLDGAVLASISRTLGNALVGSNISRLFEACGIEDRSGQSTKWKRLYGTFTETQRTDECANRLCTFIESALAPAGWTSNAAGYDAVREQINRALVMSGLEVWPNGKVHSVRAASTPDEAKERANRLRAVLEKRGVHGAVLAFRRDLLLKDRNYFHAVFEATKSIDGRLRQMSGSRLDGNPLVAETLEKGSRAFPIIALNRYDLASLVNEQQGISRLTRGMFPSSEMSYRMSRQSSVFNDMAPPHVGGWIRSAVGEQLRAEKPHPCPRGCASTNETRTELFALVDG